MPVTLYVGFVCKLKKFVLAESGKVFEGIGESAAVNINFTLNHLFIWDVL